MRKTVKLLLLGIVLLAAVFTVTAFPSATPSAHDATSTAVSSHTLMAPSNRTAIINTIKSYFGSGKLGNQAVANIDLFRGYAGDLSPFDGATNSADALI